MKKELYIFRHGQTDMNLSGHWQGTGFDFGLNQTGKMQAEELAKSLQNKGIEEIYASPLKRAFQTAEVVANSLSVPLFTNKDLIEGSFGVAEGKTKQEIGTLYPDILKSWLSPEATEMNVCFPQGETKAHIHDRLLKALTFIVETSPASIIGIAAHSAIIRFGLGIQTVEHGYAYHFYAEDKHFTRIS